MTTKLKTEYLSKTHTRDLISNKLKQSNATVRTTSRTTIIKPLNKKQVKRLVDQASYDASKLWNRGRYKLFEWLDNNNLPSEESFDSTLKRELKDNRHYNTPHSQSTQQVLEELDTAFDEWLKSDDDRDNPLRAIRKNVITIAGASLTRGTAALDRKIKEIGYSARREEPQTSPFERSSLRVFFWDIEVRNRQLCETGIQGDW